MKRPAILLTLLLLPLLHSACTGEVTMQLPAVSKGEGVLVNITIKLIPGEGRPYVSAEPSVGRDTQQSLSDAIFVAQGLSQAGEECDVLMSVSDDAGEGVEGPSGGAAFTVMAYSLYTGKPFMGNATVTGGVTPTGEITSVGGIYEKVLSAKESGMGHMLTPPLAVEEKLMLQVISGIEIHEVGSAEEAVGFFIEGTIPEERPLELEVEPFANITPYTGERVPDFERVAGEFIVMEAAEVEKITELELREYFEGKIAQHRNLSAMGYGYSAANGAFLTYISISALAEVSDPDVGGRKEEVEECLSSLNPPNLTNTNFEWMMGAQARENRARRNLELYGSLEPETLEERYLVVYELGYSKAWCEAAREMYSIAREKGGEGIEEEFFKSAAEELLNQTEETGEWDDYSRNGGELFEDGHYAAALYEFTFSASMLGGAERIKEGAAEEEFEPLLAEERSSLWGKVFRAQAFFLNQSGDYLNSYKIALFAKNMDNAVGSLGIPTEWTPPEGWSPPQPPQGEEPENAYCLSLVLLLLFPLFLKTMERK